MRQFELTAYVSSSLPGELKDWPANIQDRIYKALEAKSKEAGVPLEITSSRCDIDYGDHQDGDRYFVSVQAVEMLATSDIMSKEDMMKFTFDLMAGRLV